MPNKPSTLSADPEGIRRLADGGLLPRKEVIQPHLPVRLPCYDFAPVTSLTLNSSLPDKSGLGHWLRALPTSMA